MTGRVDVDHNDVMLIIQVLQFVATLKNKVSFNGCNVGNNVFVQLISQLLVQIALLGCAYTSTRFLPLIEILTSDFQKAG